VRGVSNLLNGFLHVGGRPFLELANAAILSGYLQDDMRDGLFGTL
jgi:hypothetical protein